jgi:hypothetical protein
VFDVTIEFYADCFGKNVETATSIPKNQIKLADVKELNMIARSGRQ